MNIAVDWTVPLDHPAFAGHFPGNPILPGVVLLDVALHAIAAHAGIALDACEISLIKFLSPVSKGESLSIQYLISSGNAIRFAISTTSRQVASGSIKAGLPT